MSLGVVFRLHIKELWLSSTRGRPLTWRGSSRLTYCPGVWSLEGRPLNTETPPGAQRPHKSLCTTPHPKAWHIGLPTAQRGTGVWARQSCFDPTCLGLKCPHPWAWGYPHLLWKRAYVPSMQPVQSRGLLDPWTPPDPSHWFSSLLLRTSLELNFNFKSQRPGATGSPRVLAVSPAPHIPARLLKAQSLSPLPHGGRISRSGSRDPSPAPALSPCH